MGFFDWVSVKPDWTSNDDVALTKLQAMENCIQAILDRNVGLDGWVDPSITGSYVSATSFSLAGDFTDYIGKGTKIKFSQTTGGAKFLYVISNGSYAGGITTYDIAENTDYVLESEDLTGFHYSNESSPIDFPHWFDSSSITFLCSTSGTIAFTNRTQRFMITGNMITMRAYFDYSSASSPVGRLQIDKSSLVATPANLTAHYIPMGYWTFSDSGATNDSSGQAHVHSSAEVELKIDGINNSYLDPADFGSGDSFFCYLQYEI